MSKHSVGRIAMFVTGESVSMDDVNNVLTSGHSYLNRKLPGGTNWLFWLASEPPKNVLKETTDGTKALIDDLPKFIGKDLKVFAKNLNKDLNSAFIKENVFVVLNDNTAKDRSVKICHFSTDDNANEEHGTEESKVQVSRATPRAAALHLYGNASRIELRENWERGKDKAMMFWISTRVRNQRTEE